MFDRIITNWRMTLGGLATGLVTWGAASNFNFNIGELISALPVILVGMFLKDTGVKQ
jgi:hypothetical protein